MCGGGVRTEPWTARRFGSGSAWVIIHDRSGFALVLRDPMNQWPRQPLSVHAGAARRRLADARYEAGLRASLVVCAVKGHTPDELDRICTRCGCWAEPL